MDNISLIILSDDDFIQKKVETILAETFGNSYNAIYSETIIDALNRIELCEIQLIVIDKVFLTKNDQLLIDKLLSKIGKIGVVYLVDPQKVEMVNDLSALPILKEDFGGVKKDSFTEALLKAAEKNIHNYVVYQQD